MTENLKNFLQKVSGDKELAEKLKGMQTVEEAIAFAGELGFTLTEADVTLPEGELSEKELGAVSGGGACSCMLAGGGGGTDSNDGKTYGCACVGYGQGGDGSPDDANCWCPGAGQGYDDTQWPGL